MSYSKHNFQSGAKLYASQLNEMDNQIYANARLIYPNGTNDTTAIQTALNTSGVALLAEGNFNVTTITMPDNATIRGFGRKSVLKTIGNVDAIHLGKHCTVESVEIVGTVEAKQTAKGTASGIVLTGTGCMATHIMDCTIHGFTECGIKFYETGTATQDSATVTGCEIYWCWCGICTLNSEYNRFAGTISRYSYYGAINLGGNNSFTGCTLGKNTIGFYMDTTDYSSAGNTGHGTCAGCSFNHCDSYGVYIKGITSGFMFCDCQLWYSPIYVNGTNAILFDACTIGRNSTITASGQGTVFVRNSMFYATPASNSIVTVSGCNLLDGTKIGDDINHDYILGVLNEALTSDDSQAKTALIGIVQESLAGEGGIIEPIAFTSNLTITTTSTANCRAYYVGRNISYNFSFGAKNDIAHLGTLVSGMPAPEKPVYLWAMDYNNKTAIPIRIQNGTIQNVSGATIASGTVIVFSGYYTAAAVPSFT